MVHGAMVMVPCWANDIVVLRGRLMSGQRDCSPCILIISRCVLIGPRHGCANKQNDDWTRVGPPIMPATRPRRCAMSLNKCWIGWQQYPSRTHFKKVAVSGLHFTTSALLSTRTMLLIILRGGRQWYNNGSGRWNSTWNQDFFCSVCI